MTRPARTEPPPKRISKSSKKRSAARKAEYERAVTLRQLTQRSPPRQTSDLSASPSSPRPPRVPLASFLRSYRIPRTDAPSTVPSPAPDRSIRSHLGLTSVPMAEESEFISTEGEVSPVHTSPNLRLWRVLSFQPRSSHTDVSMTVTASSPAVRPAAPLHPEVDDLPADVRELLPLLMPLRREEFQGVPAGRTATLDVIIDEGQALYDQGLAIPREAQARFSCARLFSKV